MAGGAGPNGGAKAWMAKEAKREKHLAFNFWFFVKDFVGLHRKKEAFLKQGFLLFKDLGLRWRLIFQKFKVFFFEIWEEEGNLHLEEVGGFALPRYQNVK